MKFIAHRGACLERQENTLEALERGAEYGAFAVECDPRYTKDGVAVLFHDDDLMRLVGYPGKVEEMSYVQMQIRLSSHKKKITPLKDVLEKFSGGSAVVFDLKKADENMLEAISKASFRTIAGVRSLEDLELAKKYFPTENILAFIPSADKAKEYSDNGAGIIRLWEHWLDDVSVSDVKAILPADREVWVMANNPKIADPLFCMDGSVTQVEKIKETGADGYILNNIRMAASI